MLLTFLLKSYILKCALLSESVRFTLRVNNKKRLKYKLFRRFIDSVS